MNLLLIEDNDLDIEIFNLALDQVINDFNIEINITYITSLIQINSFLKDSNAQFDVILSDMNLPGTNGIDVMKKFKQSKFKNIPYVFFTSSLYEKEVEVAYLEGASDYIIKPESFLDNCKLLKKIYDVYEK